MKRISEMAKGLRYGLILLMVFLAVFPDAHGQDAMEKFGKNRLQYKSFKWRYYSTENFDIYFYDGGNEIAHMAAEYLEKNFNRLNDMLGYAPYTKTEIFLYNSVTDLQQSNIGVKDNSFEVAGQTEFIKPLVEIAYPGNASKFKEELIYKISKMFIKDMMYGGKLSDMFQNSILLTLPDWYIDGAARYTAFGWDVEMDDFIRDVMINDQFTKLNKFTGTDAGIIGQSIWNYIGEHYGQSYVSNILNLTRIIRNEEKSISGSLGISFKSFLTEWQNYYLQQASFVSENYKFPSSDKQVFANNKGYLISEIKLSPEGNYMAYAVNFRGSYKVVLENIGTKKKRKVILTGGYKVLDQEFDPCIPLISWKDENTLVIINIRYGKNFLWIYNVPSGRKTKKQLTRINQIKDFDIAKGGNLAVLSADRNGHSDLYLISLRRNSIKRITNDLFDDINPRFIPGTSSIVFSSNRTTDTINNRNVKIEDIKDNYNLFIYSIDSTKKTVYRLTNTISNDIKPVGVSKNEIFYLSDQQGIFNLYTYNITDRLYHQVTDYGFSIKSYDLTPAKNQLAFVMENKEDDRVYLDNQFNPGKNIFTAQTRRKQYMNAKYVAERLRKTKLKRQALDQTAKEEKNQPRGQATQLPAEQPLNRQKTKEPRSLMDAYYRKSYPDQENLIDMRHYQFKKQIPPPPAGKKEMLAQNKDQRDVTNTDEYVFDTDVVKKQQGQNAFMNAFLQLRKKGEIGGPFPFRDKFSTQNVVTTFVIDPLIGFGIQLETQLNDVLENHKFYAGILTTADFRSGSLYAEYRYLEHTIDYHIRYHRKVYYRPTEISNQKYTLNIWEVGASLPLNIINRITLSPFVTNTNFYDRDWQAVSAPEPVTSHIYYGGIRAEYIFDNSSVKGLNMIEGARAKVGIVHYEGLNDKNKSFSKFYIDLRNYQKIHKELIFASRLYYGRFFGPNKQSFLLGGMDNWLFNKTNYHGGNDPFYTETGYDNSNILFIDYVTALRGYNYNTLNGTNAMLVNLELRFPAFRYFIKGPINSNFIKNIEFIGFYDIGSSWTGASPLATENSLNTEIISPEGNPFSAKIKNYKYPWLMSYGFGLRTMLLGYYLKFDLAYPIEDLEQQKPKFYVTLGYDF